MARLTLPSLGRTFLVLGDASGRSLAFSPGHLAGTAMPGAIGNSVISAHRDTHFRFLRQLQPGDAIEVEDTRGQRTAYRVAGTRIVDESMPIPVDADIPVLTLVTCYPFDAVMPGGPLRYLVTAMGTPPSSVAAR